MLEGWKAEDSAAARAEGWDIFFMDGDPARPELEFLQDDPTPFDSDDEVIAHVERLAAEGSPLHTKALRLERSHDHLQGYNYWERDPNNQPENPT